MTHHTDLVEKVRDAIVTQESGTYKDQARAAIRAIAEWLDDNADEQYVSSADLLRKTLKEPPHE